MSSRSCVPVDEVGGVHRDLRDPRNPRCYRADPASGKFAQQAPRRRGEAGGQEIRPAGQRCAAARPPAATARHPGVITAQQDVGDGMPRNSAGRVYCGYSSSPVAKDSSVATRCPSPPARTGHRVGRPPRRRPLRPRARKSPTESCAVAQIVGDPLVDAPRSDRTGGEAAPRRARWRRRGRSVARADRSSNGSGWDRGLDRSEDRARGAITMARATAVGRVVDRSCRSGGVLAQVVHPQVDRPAPRALASIDASNGR